MDDLSLLRGWADIAEIEQASVQSEYDLVGLFQKLRPDGERVGLLFGGLEKGDEVTQRLRNLYEVSKASFRPGDAYFMVRGTYSTDPKLALTLLHDHFRSMAKIARSEDEPELASVLEHLTGIEFVEDRDDLRREQSSGESIEVWLFDTVSDYIREVDRSPSPIRLLSEAMYGIANDKFLQGYLLWPLLKGRVLHDSPFDPYFELWARGVAYTIPAEDRCQIYVPGRTKPTNESSE